MADSEQIPSPLLLIDQPAHYVVGESVMGELVLVKLGIFGSSPVLVGKLGSLAEEFMRVKVHWF